MTVYTEHLAQCLEYRKHTLSANAAINFSFTKDGMLFGNMSRKSKF